MIELMYVVLNNRILVKENSPLTIRDSKLSAEIPA